jgi:hypothetical protein
LSEEYILHKLFEILELKEHAQLFRLAGNGFRDYHYRIKCRDIVWKNICLKNGWKYCDSFPVEIKEQEQLVE